MNPLIHNNFIDSCAFDPKYQPEDEASVEIFKLGEQGRIIIVIAHSTQKEIDHPNTPNWVKKKATDLIFTSECSLTPPEMEILEKIQIILAGTGFIENVLQDALHVFEAHKYGGSFITTDFRILNKRQHLLDALGRIFILRPSEFLVLANDRLRQKKTL